MPETFERGGRTFTVYDLSDTLSNSTSGFEPNLGVRNWEHNGLGRAAAAGPPSRIACPGHRDDLRHHLDPCLRPIHRLMKGRRLFGQEHVRRYLETDGEEGHKWNGANVLILTTRGRRSGKARSTPLIYGRHGDDYVVVASRGGSDRHPAWYWNLEAEPEVEVQVKGERFPARARLAGPAEKPALWRLMTDQWPDYDRYQQRTRREIPVVVLERRQPGKD